MKTLYPVTLTLHDGTSRLKYVPAYSVTEALEVLEAQGLTQNVVKAVVQVVDDPEVDVIEVREVN